MSTRRLLWPLSLAFLIAVCAPAAARPLPAVNAVAETAPNFDDDAGGEANADDPAIWVNQRRPGRSVIVGTLKDGGLTVFDLGGRTLQSIPAAPPPEPGRVDGRNNNVDLVYDARLGGVKGDEGLTIYAASRNRGYLLASSQGDDTYAVFADRGRGPYVESFAIADGEVDGVQESDGAAVVNASLGRRFPHGLLVTQDGFNAPDVRDDEGEVRTNTNFKLTRWDDVARAFSPTLR